MVSKRKQFNQTRAGSLLESFIAALCAAPTALLLNWYLLDLFGNDLTQTDLKSYAVFVGWVIFFFHSIIWKYIWRRLFNQYGFEPMTLIRWLKI